MLTATNQDRGSRPLVGLLVLTVMLSACGGAGSSEVIEASVDCSKYGDIVNDEDLSDWKSWALLLDVVMLPVTPLGQGKKGDVGTPYEGLRFSKAALIVRAGSVVRLEASASGKADVILAWTRRSLDNPSNVINVGPCDSNGADWMLFTGGFWLSEPACLTVVATKVGSQLTLASDVEKTAGVVVAIGDIACTP